MKQVRKNIHILSISLPSISKLSDIALYSADNINEAIPLIKKKSFDAVIFNAKEQDEQSVLAFTQELLTLQPTISIIIISDSTNIHFVIKLLNLGIYKFFPKEQKSIPLKELLKNIEHRRNFSFNIDAYRKELEQKNRELNMHNALLEKTIAILDAKVARFGNTDAKIDDIEHISQTDVLELGELEEDIEGILALISSNNNFDENSQNLLKNLFNEYASILSHYNSYKDISENLTTLYESFSFYDETSIDILDIIELLESFIYVLKNWSLSFALNDFKNTQSYHASIINDITTIIAILKGTDDEFESDIEFF